MKVKALWLRDFRNIAGLEMEPCETVNIIYGENAQGKTNLIEALWLFSGMKSFRGAKDAELVRFGAERAGLSLRFESGGREQEAKLTVTNRRTASLNGVGLSSPTGLIRQFRAVVFAPSFLSIVQSGPGERRRFLDTAVCQTLPAYPKILTEYQRLLKQRNAALRDPKAESRLEELLDVLDIQLAAAAETVAKARIGYLEKLSPAAEAVYEGLSGGREAISFLYRTRFGNDNGTYLEQLAAHRRTDMLSRTTNVGPHRDDLEICISGASARLYGSQGQQRSAALSMKLAEAAVLHNETGEQPVILLDDVMSELDARRQDYVLNHIEDRQVFITCCDPENFKRLTGGRTFFVKEGSVF